MSDDAPPRISSPASHSSVLAREMISSAKTDAPHEGAKAAARAKFEQFLAAESHPKPPATDMPLFGSSAVDVLETAALSPVPSVANTHTKSSSNDAFFASAPAPKPPTPHEHHTGERDENSVLFSLAQLSGEPGGHGAKSAASKGKSDAGVIDIKSMTNAKSAVDEILTVSAGSGLGSPLAAPMLAPVPAPNAAVASEPARSGGTNKTVVASVLGSMFILVGGGLAAMYILKSGQPATQIGTEGSGPNTANAQNNGSNGNGQNNGQNNGNNGNNGSAANTGPNNAGTPSTNGAATAPGPAGATPPAGTAPAGNEPSNRAERTPRATRSNSSSSSSSSSAPSSPSTNTPAPSNNTASAAPAGNSCAARCRGDIACLLSCGTQSRPSGNSAPSTASAAPSNAPATPGRSDVIAAMRGVQSNVRQCAASTGQSGTANINIVFASSGRVTTANVAPPFAGTPTGSCMARAVRAAVVPPFSQPTFSVNYPFSL